MIGDFRLLLPALGIWIGAFAQSLLLGINRFALATALLAIGVIMRKKLLGIFILASFVGALLLSIEQSSLQKEFFIERNGAVVQARVLLVSDVREVAGKIRGDFRQADRFMTEARVRQVDGVNLSVPFLLIGDQSLARYGPGQEIELLGKVQVFSGYSTVAGSLTQVGEITAITSGRWIWRSTSAVRARINSALQPLPSDARALIPGLVIGDRSGQDSDLTRVMQRTGLTHLTAVSGANFAIVAAFLLFIGRSLRIRGRYLWWTIALILLLFIFLVRPSSSVLRAAVMTGVLLIAKARGVRGSPIPALAGAISLLLLINPFYVRDAGFALSVFATAGLLFLAPVIQKRLSKRLRSELLAEALAIPISATLFSLPLIVVISGQLSIISIVANFLVAPVIAIITACGLILMIIAPINELLGTLLGWIITPFALWITFVARTLSALPFAALRWPQSWIGALSVIAAVCLILWILRSGRALPLILFSLALATQMLLAVKPFSQAWVPRDWTFFQCDVGQGDGLVIKSGAGRAIVIDVGPDDRQIDRCLDLLGIKQIELLVLTHFHADHVSGLAGAIEGRRVDRVWTSMMRDPEAEADLVSALLGQIPTSVPTIGTNYQSANVRLRVVAAESGVGANDSSITLIGNVSGVSFFAAGDLELAGQAQALTTLKRSSLLHLWDGQRVDFMKATHHGSALQDPALIGYLRPRVSFFSVGAGNPYGHPSQSALDQYARYGVIYRTDQDQSLALARRGGNLVVVAQPRSPWAL
ncbi:MAG: ComEC/Rec2 family competence protein [Actinobacteria bacterium]|nr:ComEC/Rec2 family competence protein [Actinomycetota bacterium]